MTHRVFSRNASSSRAIPGSKLLAITESNFVEPVRWGKNQKGMQPSTDNLTGAYLDEAKQIWRDMAEVCAKGSARLSELGLHKQWANRPLEWFGIIKAVVTSTEWDNFFNLRDHPAAMDEIGYLAQAMKVALNRSIPKELEKGQWHLPYVIKEQRDGIEDEVLCAMSSARCARVSYISHLGEDTAIEEDIGLFSKLIGDGSHPPHSSPFEHVAMADDRLIKIRSLNGNLAKGWIQMRKLIEANEFPTYLIVN